MFSVKLILMFKHKLRQNKSHFFAVPTTFYFYFQLQLIIEGLLWLGIVFETLVEYTLNFESLKNVNCKVIVKFSDNFHSLLVLCC